MKNSKVVIFVVALLLIAGTPVALNYLKSHQKLGEPGIKATPVAGSTVMNIELPANVLDYTSTNLPTSDEVLGYLPKDTSYAQRDYRAPDGFTVRANIILMGNDRTSIHKPDYCLAGHGYEVVSKQIERISVAGEPSYELPVSKWVGRAIVENKDGSKTEVHALYVFWFVADHEQTPDYGQRNRMLVRNLLTSGVLQRWAYISYLGLCLPGQEDECFERIKKLVAESVPEFQLPPKSPPATVARQ